MDEVREILENEDILVNLINFINRASELINNYVNLKYNGNEEVNDINNNVDDEVVNNIDNEIDNNIDDKINDNIDNKIDNNIDDKINDNIDNNKELNNYNNVNDIIQSSNLEPIETITIPTTTLDNIINISDTSSINDNDNLNLDLDEN
ncbi:8149_t:CDS:2, partial [Entrophospora sp. SA101]